MSRSTQYEKNPAVRTLEWKGSKGVWRYWDKASNQAKEVSRLRLAVLDELSAIRGWSEEDGGCYSNEVHNLKNSPFTVRAGGGRVAIEGLYDDIKADLPSGVKYNKVIYALDLDTNEVIKLSLNGSALSSWINSKLDKKQAVLQAVTADGKKGSVLFKVPVFDSVAIKPEEDEAAVKADEELQAYFGRKLNARHEELKETADAEEHNAEEHNEEDDELPF